MTVHKKISMNKLLVNITEELRDCIDHIAKKTGESAGSTIEFLLRNHPEVQATLKELGLAWKDRTKRGSQISRSKTASPAPSKKSPKKKPSK